MAGTVQLTNKQKVSGGVTILDEDGQPFDVLPSGVTIDFVSSNPAVAAVTVRPDGLNVDIATGANGNATLTVHANGLTKPDGTPFPDDVTNIQVVNSKPNALNFTLGAAEDE